MWGCMGGGGGGNNRTMAKGGRNRRKRRREDLQASKVLDAELHSAHAQYKGSSS
jgi:hypothetical protein